MATVKLRKPVTTTGVPTVPALSRPRTLVAEQDRARQLLERDNEQQRTSPLLGGVFVECVTPDVDQQLLVHHRLGREPQGWIVTRIRDAAVDMVEVYEQQIPKGVDRRMTLVLERGVGASVDSKFTLYVF